MKKHLFLIISLIFLLGMSNVYADFESASFDFEDYKIEHSNPPGMNSSNVWELSPGKVDDEHGTSLKVTYKGMPAMSFGQDISKGKFLISFEVNFADLNQNMRLHLTSTASGSDAHSILRMGKNGIQAASNSKSDWIFDKIYEIEPGVWNQVDMLLDMDSKKLTYYVNGKVLDERSINFVNFKHITFRTEEGTDGSIMYIDNLTFKFLSAGTFDTAYKNTVASPDSDEIDLTFSDLVDVSSLDNLKVYNMGNNPVAYSPKEVAYTIENVEAKKVTLRMAEKLGKGNIYKIYAPGVKSLLGEDFTNETAYFATGGAEAPVKVLDADFATIPSFTKPLQPVNPASDAEWTKGGTKMVYPVYDDETAVVYFAPSKGSKTEVKNYISLTRDFEETYAKDAEFEYKIKVEKGNQRFVVKDSDGELLTLITIKNDGIYNGETKISEYTAEEWFVVKVKADFEAKTAEIYKDDKKVASDIDISAIKDVAGVVFEQENTDVSYNNSEFTKDMYASSYLAYFKLLSTKACEAVTIVKFEDEDGNVYYPDEAIPSTVSKIYIKFSNAVKSADLAKNVILKTEDGEETITGTYNSEKYEYTVDLPNYLAGGEAYTLNVKGDINDANGQGIKELDGVFNTASGVVEAKNLTFDKSGRALSLATDIIHTDKSCPSLYLIYAAYDDDMVIDFAYTVINPDESERSVSVSENYEAPEDADTVSAFLWDGFDTMVPMIKMQTK